MLKFCNTDIITSPNCFNTAIIFIVIMIIFYQFSQLGKVVANLCFLQDTKGQAAHRFKLLLMLHHRAV